MKCLRPIEHWDRVFESHSRHGWLSAIFLIIIGVRLSPLGTAATTGLLYRSQIIDDGDCGKIGGSTRRKPAPAPLCPPLIPYKHARARARAAAVRSQRITALAIERPVCQRSFSVCVGKCREWPWSPVQGVLPIVHRTQYQINPKCEPARGSKQVSK
jgi:hypothetical protein